MLYASVSEKECFDFFLGQLSFADLNVGRVAVVDAPLRHLSPAALLWRDDERARGLPDAVVLRSSFKRSFLAWAHTYLSGRMPIGAFTRVLDEDDYLVGTNQARMNLNGADRALLALPACEAIASSENREDPAAVFTSACLRSCSFAGIRAMALGYSDIAVLGIVDDWWAARRILDSQTGKFTDRLLRDFFEVLLSRKQPSGKNKSLAARAVEEFERTGDLGEQTWSLLTKAVPNAPSRAQLAQGPREARVPHLQRLLAGVMATSHSGFDEDCLLGYVVNQLAPGTLEHTTILKPLAEVFPSAQLWYGVFAGLSQDRNPKGFFASTVANLLTRELERPAWPAGGPTCDVTIDELKMVREASSAAPKIRGVVPGQLCVSLNPGVEVPIRLGTRDADASAEADERMTRFRAQQALAAMEKFRIQLGNILLGERFAGGEGGSPLPRYGDNAARRHEEEQRELFNRDNVAQRKSKKSKKS